MRSSRWNNSDPTSLLFQAQQVPAPSTARCCQSAKTAVTSFVTARRSSGWVIPSNDDLLAVGVVLDDCTRENGCLLMIPGSHRWPILDHQQDGVFEGAIDVEREGVDVSGAVPVSVRAGGITLHHTRMLHASAPNTSSQPRRLLLLQLAAVDAWPVMGAADLAQFDSWVLRGQPTTRYRVAEMDIRIPLPKHERQGSIYEIQTAFRPKLFAGVGSR